MNRQDFYLNLALELNKLKVPPELINTHIDQFKQYLQTLSEEDAEKQIASFGSVGDLAANIYRLLCGSDNPPQAPECPPDEEDIYDAFRVEEDEEELAAPTTIAADVPAPTQEYLPDELSDELIDEPITAEHEQPVREQSAEDEVILDFDIFDTDAYVAPDAELFDLVQETASEPVPEEPTVDTAPRKTRQKKAAPAPQPEEPEDEYIDEPVKHAIFSENNSPLFWILFIVTLPITLPLFIVMMATFGFAYVLIALLVAVTFLCIFASAVTGALLALTGGTYGATQLAAANTAIGMYELGLALIIAGITFFLCYLFSMLSLRLIPKLFKYLTRLLRLILDRLLTLIETIKKECAQR